MKKGREQEETLRVGGRDLSIWFDKEEELWKAVVLEKREEHWVEIFSIQSHERHRVKNLFDEAVIAAKAKFSNERKKNVQESLESSAR